MTPPPYIPIVLCAGFGTRLRPLTQFLPKVVCPLVDKPFAFYAIEQFFQAGFPVVHCNVHYLAPIVQQELQRACAFFGYDPQRLRFWYEDPILETGGGISRIFHALCQEDPRHTHQDLLVASGDVVAAWPFAKMITRWEHKAADEWALLATKKLVEARRDATYIDSTHNHILGFGEAFCQQQDAGSTAQGVLFTNHQIISHQLLRDCPISPVSSIDLFYRRALQLGKRIANYVYPESHYWFNVGTFREYQEAAQFFVGKNTASCVHTGFLMPDTLEQDLAAHHHTALTAHTPPPGSLLIAFRTQKKAQGPYINLETLYPCSPLHPPVFIR